MKFSSAATYDAAASVQHQCFDTLLHYCSELSPSRILDLGCGTGTTTLQLATLFPQAKITAIDHSEDMLHFATTHNAHPNITYIQADITTYVPDTSVDLILSNAVLQWCHDPESVMDRYTPFLSSSGTLAVSYFGPDTFRDLREILTAASISTPLAADTFQRFSDTNSVREDYISILFPSFLEMLKHIKLTGTRPSETALFLTPGKAKHCEMLFLDRFSHVKLTYHAIYCIRTHS